MNKRLLSAFAAGLVCLAAFGAPVSAQKAAAEGPAAKSRAECVLEVSSRRILSEEQGDLPLPMASTTKILTAIMIIDDCDLSEKIEIPQAAAGVEGSSVYLRAGEIYSVEELLYGLMLRSGNDCAVALALHHSGSVERFAQAMNQKAARLGAEDSFFRNPHGLPAEGHHTTARDLALIAAYAMENPTFRKIVSTKYYEPRGFRNKNKMLGSFEGATGVKTGYTVQAGRCLVTSAERGGMTLVCAVLDSPEMYERSAELLEAAFSRYSMKELVKEGQIFDGCAAKRGFSYPLAEEEGEKIVFRAEKLSPLPEKRGEFAGVLGIYLENSLIFSQNLYIM